jgi:hypothetical protein
LSLVEIDNVGKKQSQQPSAMFALKFFNLCPSLDRYLLQFPDRHEHQSTKISRCNQWKKWSSGIHDIQLHIIWLNYVDLEIIAEGGGARHLTGFPTISSITSANGN